VNGNTLQQVKFKYLGLVFTSDPRWNKQIDTCIGKTNTVLRELCHFVMTKRELSNTKHCKAFFFKSFFVPILTYRHESWITTERMLLHVQTIEVGFLGRFHGVTAHFTKKHAAVKFVKP